jgi:hypothetical protein
MLRKRKKGRRKARKNKLASKRPSVDSESPRVNDQHRNHAIHHANHNPDGRANKMTIFLSVITLAAFAIPAGIAVANWQKGGVGNYWHAFGWGVVAYIFFGFGAAFTYYYAIIKPAKADQRAQAALVERPELVVERTRIDPLTPETPVTFRLDIKNRSKRVTARQVKVLTMHAIVKTDEFKGPLVYKSHPPERLFAIGPEASTSLMSASTWKITTEQITDIHAGRTFLFHYGKGSYQGDDSKELTFDFCAMFEPSVGAVVGCPEQYWPKNDDPEFISRAANRAFVIVQSSDLTVFEIGKKTEALVAFTNSGKVPATNVRIYGHIQLRDSPLAPDMPGAKDIGEEPSQDIMPANGGSALMPISSGLELTPHLRELIDKGTHRIYVWGIVTYEDMFGPHWTKFCMIQYGKTMKLEMCTNNNETDE